MRPGEQSIVSSAVVSRVVMKLLTQERPQVIRTRQARYRAIASQQNASIAAVPKHLAVTKVKAGVLRGRHVPAESTT
jgi:hypothetical protein